MQTIQENNASQNQLHPILVNLFEKRGFSIQDIKDFMSWNLHELPNMTDLKDIEKTATRLVEAMKNNEKIGIYGDYDVDGTTSCALFYHFFKMHGVEIDLVQPSRFIEGYGIHPPAIDQAISKDIKVLVTVDCGITNNEAADYAKERGLDLIITDHHKDARETMPDAYAVVNPNRRDEPEDSELSAMAGVTVAFCVCLQIKKQLEKEGPETPSLYPLLQFVAVGTICDLAPLNNTNVKLVRHGLRQLPKSKYPGLRVFLSPEERERTLVPSEKLSFGIGPMINSKGRLDHPELALKLLISDDTDEAFQLYSHLDICNKERRGIQSEVFKEAKEQVIRSMKGDEPKVSIVYSEAWHEGVIGIVASKLVETFKVPALVFTQSETPGILKASARTAGELNLFDCLNKCSDLFTKFGGHKAAAGLSMPEENLGPLKEKLNHLLSEIPNIQRTQQESYDLEIRPQDIDPKLVRELEKLEPFGMGNPKPTFKMTGFRLESYDVLKELHVRWSFTDLEKKIKLKGISFNYIDKWGTPSPDELFRQQNEKGEELSAYFTLSINRFRGNETIQLMVEKVSVGTL
jgi:single-stranded-DNA-specific exonuclease